MKTLLTIIFCLFCYAAFASNVAVIDVNTGEVKKYLISVHTQDYMNDPQYLINPDLSAVKDTPIKYWKYENGKVREMTQEEKDALVLAEQQAQIQAEEEQFKQEREKFEALMGARWQDDKLRWESKIRSIDQFRFNRRDIVGFLHTLKPGEKFDKYKAQEEIRKRYGLEQGIPEPLPIYPYIPISGPDPIWPE